MSLLTLEWRRKAIEKGVLVGMTPAEIAVWNFMTIDFANDGTDPTRPWPRHAANVVAKGQFALAWPSIKTLVSLMGFKSRRAVTKIMAGLLSNECKIVIVADELSNFPITYAVGPWPEIASLHNAPGNCSSSHRGTVVPPRNRDSSPPRTSVPILQEPPFLSPGNCSSSNPVGDPVVDPPSDPVCAFSDEKGDARRGRLGHVDDNDLVNDDRCLALWDLCINTGLLKRSMEDVMFFFPIVERALRITESPGSLVATALRDVPKARRWVKVIDEERARKRWNGTLKELAA